MFHFYSLTFSVTYCFIQLMIKTKPTTLCRQPWNFCFFLSKKKLGHNSLAEQERVMHVIIQLAILRKSKRNEHENLYGKSCDFSVTTKSNYINFMAFFILLTFHLNVCFVSCSFISRARYATLFI